MKIGDEILPWYIGIIINHYKDPYLPTGIMESKGDFFVAHLFFFLRLHMLAAEFVFAQTVRMAQLKPSTTK